MASLQEFFSSLRPSLLLKAPRRLPQVLALFLAITLIPILCQMDLPVLQGILIDALYRTQWWSEAHPDIALIAYDETSRKRNGGSSSISKDEIVKLFAYLKDEGPRLVVLLGPVNESHYTDSALAEIAHAVSTVPGSYIGYTNADDLGKSMPPALSTLNYSPGFLSKDSRSYGADSVTRRVMITIAGIPTLYARLASDLRGTADLSSIKNAELYPHSTDSYQAFIRWQGPSSTYRAFPSTQVLEGKLGAGTFKNKIVLIGRTLPSFQDEDYVFTPYSRARGETTALEGAAHSLVTLLRNESLCRPSGWWTLVLCLFLGVLTVRWVLRFSPGEGVLLALYEVLACFALAWALLFGMNIWLDLAHPLLTVCATYYLVVPFRLLDEYDKRWHYQEKSEFMLLLEEMKNNFLSLITHDLKTPVSRIHGNAELLLAQPETQKTNLRSPLQAILRTTEELSEYIESILDLTRIESAKVPIQKVSKDINSIVRDIVENKRVLADEKQIQLTTQLDTLFSIKFDIKLMTRVLSNLVENAIKYSPAGTTIQVISREEGPWVKVEVRDQGMGISAQDQNRIFEKFYRCPTSETKAQKGSGLGLYLVKYFVEMHSGFVELKSELGRGSVFTIALPVS